MADNTIIGLLKDRLLLEAQIPNIKDKQKVLRIKSKIKSLNKNIEAIEKEEAKRAGVYTRTITIKEAEKRIKKNSSIKPDKTNVAAVAIDKFLDISDAINDAQMNEPIAKRAIKAMKILFAILLMFLSPRLLLPLFYDNFNDWQWFRLTIIVSIFTFLGSYIAALHLDYYKNWKRELESFEMRVFADNSMTMVKTAGSMGIAFLTFIATIIFYPGLEVLMLYSNPNLMYFSVTLMVPQILAFLLLSSWILSWNHYRILKLQ